MASAITSDTRPRRIAYVQLDSKHADVVRNTDIVLSLVAKLVSERHSNPIDLLVLPELALTGYVFKSKQEIDPLLEDAAGFKPPPPIGGTEGTVHATAQSPSTNSFLSTCRNECKTSLQPSLTLAAHLAQHLHCHVVIGFPERASGQPLNSPTKSTDGVQPPFDARPKDAQTSSGTPSDQQGADTQVPDHRAFNSAALLAPDGSLQHVFRKHFLFETDQVWAVAGAGFEIIHLPTLGNVCVAICMDLNPFQFRTSFEACELATFCLERDVDLLVVPMAWLLPKDETTNSHESKQSPTWSAPTVNYWAIRCRPFWDSMDPQSTASRPAPTSPHPSLQGPSHQKVRYLVANNRTGTEATSTFAGSSCVLQMKRGERPLLLDCLGIAEESCQVVTLPS